MLGLGTVQLGMAYGVANTSGMPSGELADEILHKAYAGGIRVYDTAAGYGESETRMGKFVKNIGFNDIKISTKAGALSENRWEEAIDRSFERLGVDSVHYFLLHNANDIYKYGGRITDFFTEMKRTDRIKKFGVSVYKYEDIMECAKYGVIDVIQAPVSILDQRLIRGGVLAELSRGGIEVHARSIYLQGLIMMDTENIPRKLSGVRVYIEALDSLCKETGFTRKQLAFLFIRDNPDIDVFFVGCESLTQLEENLMSDKLPPLDMEKVMAATKVFEGIPESIVNPALW